MATEEITTPALFEEWLAIPGYEGRYEVSDRGGIRSLYFAYRKPPPPRYPRCTPSTDGYPCVGLSRGGTWKHFRVHILVMLAFVGPCPEGQEINHKDGDKTNNCLTNLEYRTHRENMQHAVDLGLMHHGDRSGARTHPEQIAKGERHGMRVLTEEKVREIRRRYAAGGITQKQLAQEYGVGPATILKIVRRLRWAHLPDEEVG